MNGLTLLAIAGAVLLGGYFIYSRILSRILGVDPSRPTPANTLRDDIDYVPAHPTVLFGHHFAAIAGAGPIVGPVLAAEFGWASVALWILLGCVFIGAAHDMIALHLSVRHEGKSIGTVIGELLGPGGRVAFLLFCWSALILVVAEFTRQIAATFVSNPEIASASLLFIAEAIIFGLCVYRFKMGVLLASSIFVPLMFAFVWIGSLIPFDLVKMGLDAGTAQTVWTLVLLAYCFFASTMPVWLLLQPRDYLNAYLLYAMMILGVAGVVFAHPHIQMEAFTSFAAEGRGGVQMLFPFLFVTVACGACSGFHALVASGTTAKQLASEKSTRLVGYGAMLLEGLLATLALIGVAGTWDGAGYLHTIQTVKEGGLGVEPVAMFAGSLAGFFEKVLTAFGAGEAAAQSGVAVARSFMLLAVSAFLMTSVDAATRLARFTWQELFPVKQGVALTAARKTVRNMYTGTAIVVALVAMLLLGNAETAKSLWTNFASANQLLASLTLLTASLWLLRNGKNMYIAFIPMCFMLATSLTAVVQLLIKGVKSWYALGFAAGFIGPGLMSICTAALLVLAVFTFALGVKAFMRANITK